MIGETIKPKQRISKHKKTEEWLDNNVKYYAGACKPAIDSIEADRLYKMANGYLIEEDYKSYLNPLNTTRRELTGYPGKMKNFDIISPNLNALMGDKKARNFPPIVIAKNTDHNNIKKKEETRKLQRFLHTKFINDAAALGIELTPETVSQTLESIQKDIRSIPDEMSQNGQDALEFIRYYNRLPSHFRKGFYDWLVTAMVFSYKDVIDDKTYYQIISPFNVSYLKSAKSDFLEDGEAACVRHYLSINEVHDKFSDLKGYSKIKEYLDSSYNFDDSKNTQSNLYALSDVDTLQRELFLNLGINPDGGNIDAIVVEHVVWRSKKKVYRIKVQSLTGEIIEETVDEDYKFNKDEEYETEYIDTIFEGYLIDGNHVIGATEIPTLIGDNAKLPYNGRVYFSRVTAPQSIVKKGEPYQKLVNIVRYMMEKTLVKNLDKLVVFPLGLIPKKDGWDEKTVMYYAQATSFLFVDETNPKAAAALNALKQLDLSLYEYVSRGLDIVRELKAEWDDVSGISQQRKANIAASAGKKTTEIAIDRSFVISEELFTQYEEFEETEYNSLLNLSKYSFIDGIEEAYVKDNKEVALFKLDDPEKYALTEFKVFIKNNTEELQKLRELKANAQAFAQNASNPSLVAELIDDNNMSSIIEKMKTAEEEMLARSQAQAEAEREAALEEKQLEVKDNEAERELKYYEADLAASTDVEVALIKEKAVTIAQKIGEVANTPDDNNELDRSKDVTNNILEMMKLKQAEREMQSKERIERAKNKTALKNKVSGEK